MRAVSVFCYHFQAFDRVGIADDVVQCVWPVFFNPGQGCQVTWLEVCEDTDQGNSYAVVLVPFAGSLPFADVETIAATEEFIDATRDKTTCVTAVTLRVLKRHMTSIVARVCQRRLQSNSVFNAGM